jgi:hypothetical protein
VLVVGGKDNDPAGRVLASAERYQPWTGTFVPAGTMTSPRMSATATTLGPGDGRVLVAGGSSDSSNALTSAELYDRRTGTFSPTGSLADGRAGHVATYLADGRILIVGGDQPDGNVPIPLLVAEVYDPASGTFTATSPMAFGRHALRATADGPGALITSGGDLTGVDLPSELFDLSTLSFYRVEGNSLVAPFASATALLDGDVLVAGGLVALDSVPTGSTSKAWLFTLRPTGSFHN